MKLLLSNWEAVGDWSGRLLREHVAHHAEGVLAHSASVRAGCDVSCETRYGVLALSIETRSLFGWCGLRGAQLLHFSKWWNAVFVSRACLPIRRSLRSDRRF